MWISGKQIGHAYRETRKFFRNTYHEGKKWAHTIDGYAQLFRRALGAATPMLQDLGVGKALGAGVQALQQYDTARKQVMDIDERGRGYYDQISRAVA